MITKYEKISDTEVKIYREEIVTLDELTERQQKQLARKTLIAERKARLAEQANKLNEIETTLNTKIATVSDMVDTATVALKEGVVVKDTIEEAIR